MRAVIWDHESCAHCGMTISDHRFACQLQTTAGRIYDFDDPGCLLRYLAEKHPQAAAIYFHGLHSDNWIKASEAAFVTGQNTPMGYGLGAVAAATPGALSLEDAARMVRVHDRPEPATDSRDEAIR